MPSLTIHEFIRELEANATHYALQIAIPGERWEVEFFSDREPELEVFRSDGDIVGGDALQQLLAKMKE